MTITKEFINQLYDEIDKIQLNSKVSITRFNGEEDETLTYFCVYNSDEAEYELFNEKENDCWDVYSAMLDNLKIQLLKDGLLQWYKSIKVDN